jgi:hypothetical protein
LIVDYRRQQREHVPIHIDRAAVERVKSFKFLGDAHHQGPEMVPPNLW